MNVFKKSTKVITIDNDLDGGIDFWPRTTFKEGMLHTTTAKALKETLTDEWFAKHPAKYPDKQATLKNFLGMLEEKDLVIMLVR